MTVKYLQVKLRRITAIIRVDLDLKEFLIVSCSNANFCRNFVAVDGCCPAYCEIVVAAKDFVYGRRKPKANVFEIEEGDIEIKI